MADMNNTTPAAGAGTEGNPNQQVNTTGEGSGEVTGAGEGSGERTPSVNELIAKIASLEADKAKQKNAITKLTSENSNLHKSLTERMTADELKQQEEEKAREEQELYVKDLEKKVALSETTQRYVGMGMEPNLAAETALLEVEGNMEGVAANWKKHTEQIVKNEKAKWMNDRPQANIGGSGETTVTKEQFDKMGYKQMLAFKEKWPEKYEEYTK